MNDTIFDVKNFRLVDLLLLEGYLAPRNTVVKPLVLSALVASFRKEISPILNHLYFSVLIQRAWITYHILVHHLKFFSLNSGISSVQQFNSSLHSK